MRLLLLIMIQVALLSPAKAEPIRIAIIDTGVIAKGADLKLCKSGHIDLTGEGLHDRVGHGTNVSYIMVDRLRNVDYCLIIVKFFSVKQNNEQNMISALRWIDKIKPDIVNISAGGGGYYNGEYDAVIKLLNNKIFIVAAAGNNGHNLDIACNYYPACYDNRIITVGNRSSISKNSTRSNYGSYVKVWVDGQNVCAGGFCMSGTSQAAAIVSARLARMLFYQRQSCQK